MSITGDPALDALVPVADRLVAAVRDMDPVAVAAALDGIDTTRLAVLLAAMVADDSTAEYRLGWLRDPDEYRRLRAEGVGHYSALNCARLRETAA